MGLTDLFSELVSGNDAREGEMPETVDSDENDRSPVVYECRNCGTTVSPTTNQCPSCGAEEIATYPID